MLVTTVGIRSRSPSRSIPAAWWAEAIPRPATWWLVMARTRPPPSSSRHCSTTRDAASNCCSAKRAPMGESAPSATTMSRPAQCCAIISTVALACPRSAWAALMSSHRCPQPEREVAHATTLGSRGSRSSPPRAAVGCRSGCHPAGTTARSTPMTGSTPAFRHAFANRTAP